MGVVCRILHGGARLRRVCFLGAAAVATFTVIAIGAPGCWVGGILGADMALGFCLPRARACARVLAMLRLRSLPEAARIAQGRG